MSSYLAHLALNAGITAGVVFFITGQFQGALLIGATSAAATYAADRLHLVDYV